MLITLVILAALFVMLGGVRIMLSQPRAAWLWPAALFVLVLAATWRWGAAGLGLAAASGIAAYFLSARLGATADADTSLAAARALLGVGPEADETEIRQAYRNRMRDAHPDLGGRNDAAARLNAARDLLLRAKRRASELRERR